MYTRIEHVKEGCGPWSGPTPIHNPIFWDTQWAIASQHRSTGYWRDNAQHWMKDEAGLSDLLHELAAVSQGAYIVRKSLGFHPGDILFEDKHQIVVRYEASCRSE